MKIGVLGGTFDPIHNGHLVLAQQVMDRQNLDFVYFIPAKIPPHKKDKKIVSSRNRYDMVKLAIEGNDDFKINDMELKREGISFSYDTIVDLKKLHPEATIYFISGADTIFQLDSWKKIGQLLSEVVFIAAYRHGYDLDLLSSKVTELNKRYDGNIVIQEISELEISSTEIRNKIAMNESVRYIIPDAVIAFIGERGLYSG